MIKYVPVFGPQRLFNTSLPHSCVIHAERTIGGGVLESELRYFFFGEEDEFYATLKKLIAAYSKVEFAMRKGVAITPTWTKADQLDGKLPEVGAEYNVDGCIVKHLGTGAAGYENIFYFEYPSGACGNAHMRSAKQLETPEEKASRLKDEWGARATELFMKSDNDAAFDFIYDALLSGELSAPVNAEDGAE